MFLFRFQGGSLGDFKETVHCNLGSAFELSVTTDVISLKSVLEHGVTDARPQRPL
jgi:hypothetical protein